MAFHSAPPRVGWLLLLPSPLWGGVGGGGRGMGHLVCRNLTTPHPDPPPKVGREQKCHTYSNTVRPATMVRVTRPCSLASSNGVFLHLDLSAARSSTHGASGSNTTTSAG